MSVQSRAQGAERRGPITIETVAEEDVQKLAERDVYSLLEAARQDAHRIQRFNRTYTEPSTTAWDRSEGGPVRAFATTASHAAFTPEVFFRELQADGVPRALAFVAILLIPAAIVQSLTAPYWLAAIGAGVRLPSPGVLLLYVLTALPLGLLYFIVTYRAGATLLSRRRLRMTGVVRATCFGFAPMALALIPGIGLVAGVLWSLSLHFVALREHLGLHRRLAFIAVSMPIIPVVLMAALEYVPL